MGDSTDTMVRLLRGTTLVNRTGLLFLPVEYFSKIRDIAAKLEVDPWDAQSELVKSLPPEVFILNLDAESLYKSLQQAAGGESVTGVLLVFNLDLPLARLLLTERQQFWDYYFKAIRYPKTALIVALPNTSQDCMPSYAILEELRGSGRVAIFQ